ncbi:MAG: hypothetical protein FWD25_00715 [Clostridia bacterium]|nr:hypothetical protein [Clostridia bacterium]
MDEHVLLEQIAGLFETQTTQIRQEMQEALSAQEARMNEKFNAVDKKFDEMADHIMEVAHILTKQIEQSKADTIHEVRVLNENVEGDKIHVLADETVTHKGVLADHEERIANLEGLVSAG